MFFSKTVDSRVTLYYPILGRKFWQNYWPEVQVSRIG